MKGSAIARWLGCACAAGALSAPAAWAQTLHARLSGYQAVPAVSSPGSGEFDARINARSQVLEYDLTLADLQGKPIMAHVRFGQAGVVGGIVIWLCGNPDLVIDTGLPPVPAGVPRCPVPGGTVSADTDFRGVVGPDAQLIGPGEFDEAVAAMRAGATYVNVHTTAAPSGELRGQVR